MKSANNSSEKRIQEGIVRKRNINWKLCRKINKMAKFDPKEMTDLHIWHDLYIYHGRFEIDRNVLGRVRGKFSERWKK